MRDLEGVAHAFHEAADAAEVAYAFVGGLAVMAWGQPRATSDVDALVVLPASKAASLADALREHDLTVETSDLIAALGDPSHVRVFDERSNYHVDVRPTRTPEERREVEDAATVELHGRPLRVVQPRTR